MAPRVTRSKRKLGEVDTPSPPKSAHQAKRSKSRNTDTEVQPQPSSKQNNDNRTSTKPSSKTTDQNPSSSSASASASQSESQSTSPSQSQSASASASESQSTSASPSQSASPSTPPLTLTLTHTTGNLFSSPPHTLLLHACNCLGIWGGGIAAVFATQYPGAYAEYQRHCATTTPDAARGTALLIAPQPGDAGPHFVGCLFTSRGVGRGRDGAGRILEATGDAVRGLLTVLREVEGVAGVRMCRINEGLFRVPWASTRRVLEGVVLGEEDVVSVIDVVSREE